MSDYPRYGSQPHRRSRAKTPDTKHGHLMDIAVSIANDIGTRTSIRLVASKLFESQSSTLLDMERDYWASVALKCFRDGLIDQRTVEDVFLILVSLGHKSDDFKESMTLFASAINPQ